MDDIQQSAYTAIRAAVEKCPVGTGAMAEVDAAHVVILARAIAPSERSQRVTDLGIGALKALGGKPSVKVVQHSDELRHLLTSVPGEHDPLTAPSPTAPTTRRSAPTL